MGKIKALWVKGIQSILLCCHYSYDKNQSIKHIYQV